MKARMLLEAVLCLVAVASGNCQTIATSLPVVATATQPEPATRPGNEDDVRLRQVVVTMLGKTSDVHGMQWPDDPEGRWLSRGIEEPCALTVRLPSGKVLKMRTRPILIVSREDDTVISVYAPPEGKPDSLLNKALEVESLLAQWRITPDERLRAGLDEWKKRNYGGTGIGGQLRVGSELDERTSISFRADSGGPPRGGWYLVVEIEAKAEEMEQIWRKARARKALTTQPSQSPSAKP